MINTIIYNKSGQIRHIWKFLLTLLLIFACMLFPVILMYNLKLDSRLIDPFFIGLIAGVLLSFKFVYKASFRNLGLILNKKNLLLIFIGIVISVADQVPRYLIDKAIFNHSTEWTFPEFNKGLLIGFFGFILVASGEELFFRVYLIGYFKEKLNLVYLFLFSAVLFSVGHSIGNPNYDYISFLIFLLKGIFFGLLYLLSGSFYLVMSAHAVHNTIHLYYCDQSTYMAGQLIEVIVVFILVFFQYRKKKLSLIAEAA